MKILKREIISIDKFNSFVFKTKSFTPTKRKIISFFNNILYKTMLKKNRTRKTIYDKWKKIISSPRLVDLFLQNFIGKNIKCIALPFEVSIKNTLFRGTFDFLIKEGDEIQIGIFDFFKHDLEYYKSNFIYSIYKESFIREFNEKHVISIYNIYHGKFFNFAISESVHKKNLTRNIRFAKLFIK